MLRDLSYIYGQNKEMNKQTDNSTKKKTNTANHHNKKLRKQRAKYCLTRAREVVAGRAETQADGNAGQLHK